MLSAFFLSFCLFVTTEAFSPDSLIAGRSSSIITPATVTATADHPRQYETRFSSSRVVDRQSSSSSSSSSLRMVMLASFDVSDITPVAIAIYFGAVAGAIYYFTEKEKEVKHAFEAFFQSNNNIDYETTTTTISAGEKEESSTAAAALTATATATEKSILSSELQNETDDYFFAYNITPASVAVETIKEFVETMKAHHVDTIHVDAIHIGTANHADAAVTHADASIYTSDATAVAAVDLDNRAEAEALVQEEIAVALEDEREQHIVTEKSAAAADVEDDYEHSVEGDAIASSRSSSDFAAYASNHLPGVIPKVPTEIHTPTTFKSTTELVLQVGSRLREQQRTLELVEKRKKAAAANELYRDDKLHHNSNPLKTNAALYLSSEKLERHYNQFETDSSSSSSPKNGRVVVRLMKKAIAPWRKWNNIH